jgi:hypothetical protein
MILNAGSNYKKINGLYNIGIMNQYAYTNIKPLSNIGIFMGIVGESLGHGNLSTPHKTQEYWANKFYITKNTFNKIIHRLEDNGYININHPDVYMKDGGSIPYSYSPVIPKNTSIWTNELEEPQW